MRATTIAARFLVAGLFAVLLSVAGPARADSSYIADPGEAARAFDALVAETGGKPHMHALELSDRRLTIDTLGKRPGEMDEWQIGRVTRLFLEFETIVGPRPVRSAGLVGDTDSGFFDRSEIALEKVPEVAASAIAYARLDEEAHVQSIEISRQVEILPRPAYGDIRWSIYVTSGRESAIVRTDAAGNIIGADLANTNRARNMDLLGDGDWPHKEARDALFAVFGDQRRLRDVTVRPRAISVTADHPDAPGRKEDYNWTISGVTRSPLLSPLMHGASEDELFSLQEVDFTALARIRAIARNAWGHESAKLDYMTLRRVGETTGKPELRWIVTFTELGTKAGEATGSGNVEVTPDGTVRKVALPAGRASAADWLAPASISATLGQLGRDFGPGGRFAEIVFDADKARILGEDPAHPGAMAGFEADAAGLSRTRRLMPWDEQFRKERLFDLKALTVFTDGDGLADFTARTYRRLQADEESMPQVRYAFAIGQIMGPDGTYMVPSPDGRPTLQVRLENADGSRIGRVVYDSSGREIDVRMP
ncbi:hypothetical protein [Rhizobium sp. GN54]|uniref:hypothetical protein n=1 Tax=Rhizobium sp. GN54 TaxID=2898150 RepID=UPI001E51F3AA|nr:hypothetical protein [Rhizobium sp. GN54]MCD2181869.1 hypothetical protein [Rhizobium sp. GN54]